MMEQLRQRHNDITEAQRTCPPGKSCHHKDLLSHLLVIKKTGSNDKDLLDRKEREMTIPSGPLSSDTLLHFTLDKPRQESVVMGHRQWATLPVKFISLIMLNRTGNRA